MDNQINNKYCQELKCQVTRLSALYEILKALNSVIESDELLTLILQKTKELLNSDGASIIFWDNSNKVLYFPVVLAEDERTAIRLRNLSFSCNVGIAGWVFREGKPIIVQDVNEDKRFYKGLDEHTKFKTRSILCVPLSGKNGIFGVLEVVNKKIGAFSEDDQDLLIAMADYVAICIEKSRLYHDLLKTEAILRHQNAELKLTVKQEYSFKNIIGRSKKMSDLIKRAEHVALTDASVLIYGETGTGKEMIAQAIHNCSPRASRNFVAINCGAIPENLLESELFGHEKGAFTSATTRRIGLFEEAHYGTLFLDEIGDMPLTLQVKLLRVLQDRVIQRLGSNRNIFIDVRVIAATHHLLEEFVKTEKFRPDLYYRLKGFELKIPPLRERKEDIPILIDYFIDYYNKKTGKHVEGIEDDANEILLSCDYPGNVRELQHIIERAIILSKKNTIGIAEIPNELSNLKPFFDVSTPLQITSVPINYKELKFVKARERKKAEERIEKLFLNKLLSRVKGNITEAALLAKMNRSWLSQLISKYKIDVGMFKNIKP